jgi:hypothetical protein
MSAIAVRRPFPWWIVGGAALIAALYLPSLRTPFDFIDDGNLVYPTQFSSIVQRLDVVWDKIRANYEHLGPFRPVPWVHWEIEADLFHGSAFAWRSARLCWCVLAAGMMLWLLSELRISRWAALLATALAMWNPFRNEIWTSLTLAEGVAMPYALLGLIAAIRAARSPHRGQQLGWDLAALFGTLMAMGCKNVFVALIPAQMFLRLCPDGFSLREGRRNTGWRSLVLALPVLAFVAHFIYFESNWHAGQYRPPGPSIAQLIRYLNGIKGAMSLDFVGFGVGACVAALLISRRFVDIWRSHSSAIVAGTLLAVSGIAVYLPMDALSGRYTMPAVWGIDLFVAVVISSVISMPSVAWRRVAIGSFACGLAGVAIANVGRQDRFRARAEMFWQLAHWVEDQPSSSLAWISDSEASTGGRSAYASAAPALNVEEGIHFDWHLQARNRGSWPVQLFDERGQTLRRVDFGRDSVAPPTLVVTACAEPPTRLGTSWERVHLVEVVYWGGLKRYSCSVWTRGSPARLAQAPSASTP